MSCVVNAKLKVLLALSFLATCLNFSLELLQLGQFFGRNARLQLGIKAGSLFIRYLSGTSANGFVGLLDVSLTISREPSINNTC